MTSVYGFVEIYHILKVAQLTSSKINRWVALIYECVSANVHLTLYMDPVCTCVCTCTCTCTCVSSLQTFSRVHILTIANQEG